MNHSGPRPMSLGYVAQVGGAAMPVSSAGMRKKPRRASGSSRKRPATSGMPRRTRRATTNEPAPRRSNDSGVK